MHAVFLHASFFIYIFINHRISHAKEKSCLQLERRKRLCTCLVENHQSDEYEILFLLTTVNQETTRSTMHGIPMELLQAQSRSISIPLKIIGLRPRGDMDDYNRAMTEAVEELKAMGITHFIFGDIFLYDVMQYRKRQLEPMGIQVVEPLWGKNTVEVMDDFLQTRLKTIIVTTMHDGLGKKLSEKTSMPNSSLPFPPAATPTEKTENTTPSATTVRYFHIRFLSAWESLSWRAMISNSTQERYVPTLTGLPT